MNVLCDTDAAILPDNEINWKEGVLHRPAPHIQAEKSDNGLLMARNGP